MTHQEGYHIPKELLEMSLPHKSKSRDICGRAHTKDIGKWKKGHTMNSSPKCKALVMPRKKYSGNYMMFGLMVFFQL